MAGRHEQAIAQSAAKAQIGTSFWQVNVANGQALGVEYPDPIQPLGLGVHAAIAAPTAPNVAIFVDCNPI